MGSRLTDIFKEINKESKNEFIAGFGITRAILPTIPFSSPQLNWLLRGGIPRGRLAEFFGDNGSGKTTSSLDLCSQAQMLFKEEYDDRLNELQSCTKLTKVEQAELDELLATGPKKVAFIDAENTLDEKWARKLGVDIDAMGVIKPDENIYAEELFDITLDIISTGEVGLVILDSLGVLVSKQEAEKDMDEATYGGISKSLTRFSKRAVAMCAHYNCTLVAINQKRDNLKSQHGGTTTPGGRGWKHNCVYRLDFTKGSFIDENCKEIPKATAIHPHGNMVGVAVEKNKVTTPDRRLCWYTLNYTHGVDVVNDVITLACSLGIIDRSGAWYQIVDKETGEILQDSEGDLLKFQGTANMYNYLNEHDDIVDMIIDKIKDVS